MLLVGRIVKREENTKDLLADTTYLIGVSAMNLAKDVGDTIDLVPVERLKTMKIPEWALARFREKFPGTASTNEDLRRQLQFWQQKMLPEMLKGRRR